MKKAIFIIAFLVSSGMFAQLEGMRYQAVITNPNAQEVPGYEPLNNILPKRQLTIRFTIFKNEVLEYEEVHLTRTDEYGMIDIIIGQGIKTARSLVFEELLWYGESRELLVEVNLQGNYETLEKQELLYVPYAYHRDIIVTKDMVIDGLVQFAGDLVVDGSTTLNNSLSVLNESEVYLSGRLLVEGVTRLNDSLIVANESVTLLRGTLDVDQATQLESRLNVKEATNLNNSLDADGRTLIDNSLTVANESATQLTGELKVGGEANFNGNVSILNDSDLNLSGDLLIGGATTFDGDLTVDGLTQLNNGLNVNNETPSLITGTLTVDKATTLESSLQVFERTQLEGSLNVNNESPTNLSGTLTVEGETNLNDALNITNNAHVVLTGDLTVGGSVVHEDDLIVNGKTSLNDALFVNNNAPTALTGTLEAGDTSINQTLNVNGATTMLSSLEVLNSSPTRLTGTLDVTNATILNNTLTVANSSPSRLSGSLTVDGATTLNNNLSVTNAANSSLTGTMIVDGATRVNKMAVTNNSGTSLTGTLEVELPTTLNNSLLVAGAAPTQLTGTLEVDGFTVFNDPLTVALIDPTSLTGTLEVIGVSNLQETLLSNGAVLIDNSLTVNGLTSLESISAKQIAVSGNIADQGNMVDTDYVAIFENDNTATGDGVEIKLGKQHGALIGTNTYANISNPIFPLLGNAVTVIGNKLENLSPTTPPSGPFITPTELLQMVPASALAGTAAGLANSVVETLNSRLGLPISTPAIEIPGRRLLSEIVFFGGISEQCTGQYCFDPCPGPIDCDICIPPVAFCLPSIPRIAFPEVNMPTIPILPSFNNIIPAIPTIPVSGLDAVQFPDIQTSVNANSLTKENSFVTFQDNMGREAGSISGQSFGDFKDDTIGDNIYVLNIAAEFVGIDLLGGLTSGSVAISNLIDEYNKIGVSYNSGNGDYAEWLERIDPLEHLTAGDIVGVRGGKITKDLSHAEQLMVVSHQPIVLGNHPDMDRRHLGNSVAFIGQVPVKVMGPVASGDYIVTHPELVGYGIAIAPNEMNANDHANVVGRSWETKAKPGFKLVNTVVGVQNGDWNAEVNKLVSKQNLLDRKVETLEEKLARIEANLNAADDVQPIYASHDE